MHPEKGVPGGAPDLAAGAGGKGQVHQVKVPVEHNLRKGLRTLSLLLHHKSPRQCSGTRTPGGFVRLFSSRSEGLNIDP
jgi:hypothetical protein